MVTPVAMTALVARSVHRAGGSTSMQSARPSPPAPGVSLSATPTTRPAPDSTRPRSPSSVRWPATWAAGCSRNEIYRGAELDGRETPSAWGRHDRVIVTGGLSKTYGLPGLRIGWIVGPAQLVEQLWGRHDYTTIAPGSVNDLLARLALAPSRRDRLIARTRDRLRENQAIVRDWVSQQPGVGQIPPEAGRRHTLALCWSPLVGRAGRNAADTPRRTGCAGRTLRTGTPPPRRHRRRT